VVRIRRRENVNLRRKSLREISSLGLSGFELLLNSYVFGVYLYYFCKAGKISIVAKILVMTEEREIIPSPLLCLELVPGACLRLDSVQETHLSIS
jgi:hypothetical protein